MVYFSIDYCFEVVAVLKLFVAFLFIGQLQSFHFDPLKPCIGF